MTRKSLSKRQGKVSDAEFQKMLQRDIAARNAAFVAAPVAQAVRFALQRPEFLFHG